MTSAPRPDDISSSWHETDTTARDQADDREVVLTRSEEQLHVSTIRVPTTRVRFRKRIVTETKTVSIEVSREELVQEQEPITGAGSEEPAQVLNAPDPQDIEIVLHEQRPVITMETVAVERIRVRTHTVTDDQTITGTVGKEQIELHHDPVPPTALPTQSERHPS